MQEKRKKVVLQLELHNDKGRQKAMKAVAGHLGIETIAMKLKDEKMTLTGNIDPVTLVAKLRKICNTEIETVGPAKEEKKKEEPKKEDPKKADVKKKDQKDDVAQPAKAHNKNPHIQTYRYQEVVLQLELHDHKDKEKAGKKVFGLSGIDSIAMDMKDKKLTLKGNIDPVTLVVRLRKICPTQIETVGPAKEEKKKEEPKEEAKKADVKKKDQKDDVAQPAQAHNKNPHIQTCPYQEVVLRLELHDKNKEKAGKKVFGLSGIDSIAMDMKDKKLTLKGNIDPLTLGVDLKKICPTQIVTVGPAKEEKKKEEPKKEKAKKADEKKNDELKKKDKN